MKKSIPPSVNRPQSSVTPQSSEALQAVLKSTSEAVVGMNRLGDISFMNSVAEKITGISLKDALQKRIEEVVVLRKEATGEPVRLPVQEVVDLGTRVQISQLVLVSKSGEEIPVQDTWMPILSETQEGNIKQANEGVVLVCQDLREKRLAEDKSRDLEAQIRHAQKLESVGILAGGIAHDFNNLLTVILGNVNLALATPANQELVHSKLKMIEKTSIQATELVKQLLSYSGKSKRITELTNLSHLVGEMGTLLQTSISKKVDLNFVFDERIPVLKADVAQLRQVIMNLIINASDAMGDKRGQIQVETGVMDADQEFLSHALMGQGLKPGKYVYLQVADTGSGMSEATQAKIFDPFFTTKVTGRGLGLAVVLGIIKTQGGGLTLQSKEGVGTTFRVFFPAEEAYTLRFTELGVAPTPAVAKPSKRGGTILVVDDEGNILTLIKEVLEHEGFKVLTAESGTDGVGVYKEKNSEIDAVFLDMSMPDMDGTEALDQMRHFRSDIKVLVSSGYHEDDIITRLTEHGIKHFIQKPFMPDKLISKVYEALEVSPSTEAHL
jgi:two-component system cell cycle sensor histidine kinase/response regulator CckA